MLSSVNLSPQQSVDVASGRWWGEGAGIGAFLPLLALCLLHSCGSSTVLLCREIVVLVQLLKYEAIAAYFRSGS